MPCTQKGIPLGSMPTVEAQYVGLALPFMQMLTILLGKCPIIEARSR